MLVQNLKLRHYLRGWALDNGHDPDAKPVARAYYDRLRTMERFAIFLGHRDASRVSKADAVRWKEEMQGRGKTASTVSNDLSEMSAVWVAAIRNGRLAVAETCHGRRR